jgi:hypothetical protein
VHNKKDTIQFHLKAKREEDNANSHTEKLFRSSSQTNMPRMLRQDYSLKRSAEKKRKIIMSGCSEA